MLCCETCNTQVRPGGLPGYQVYISELQEIPRGINLPICDGVASVGPHRCRHSGSRECTYMCIASNFLAEDHEKYHFSSSKTPIQNMDKLKDVGRKVGAKLGDHPNVNKDPNTQPSSGIENVNSGHSMIHGEHLLLLR